LPILDLLAMRSGGLRHIFILRHKPSFCLCASVSRLSTRLLILVTELALGRPQKITFAEMRDMGVRGVPIYCADYRCSHSVAVMADQWADDIRLSDIEDRFTCSACGKRGADVRPDFNWNRQARTVMAYQ
jgi:hypothetical protein